jgi:Holliday junction resolvase
MTNKKLGNDFESELCKLLSSQGFWAHRFTQNCDGQPADIIAVKNKKAYLIDAKVCSTKNGFALHRLEDNQILAMQLWESCENGSGWFALQLETRVYMLPLFTMLAFQNSQSYVSPSEIAEGGEDFERWVKKCR